MNKLKMLAIVVVLMNSAVMGMMNGWLCSTDRHVENNGVWDGVFTVNPEEMGTRLVRSTAPVPSASNPQQNVSSSSSADSVCIEVQEASEGSN